MDADELRRREQERSLREELETKADVLYADHLRPSQRPWECPACEQVRRVRRGRDSR